VKRLSLLIFVFAILFAFFLLSPGLLNQPFRPYPLMKVADVLDLLTPIVLIPLYYLLLFFGSEGKPTLQTSIIFLVLAAIWVEGQGMHLAANSIGHFLDYDDGSQLSQITYFYDEILSHYFWHFGIVAISAQLIYRSWRYPFSEGVSHLFLEILAGIVYGITFFIIGIEGGTVPLTFSFAVLATLVCLIWGWNKYRQTPVVSFFLVGYGLAVLLGTVWGLYWGGFPQFSELGWF
jgi:hypothetical protein